MTPCLRIILCALILPFAFSCAHHPEQPEKELGTGRPSPAYIRWIEEQSCLRRVPDLLRIVSGSHLSWSEKAASFDILSSAPTWLAVSPDASAWSGGRSFFLTAASRDLAGLLSSCGFQGLLVSSAFESGRDWKGLPSRHTSDNMPACMEFSRTAGTEEEYAGLQRDLAGAGLFSGGEILPSAIAAGPDFTLAVHGVRDYPSLFAMEELPRDVWHLLPDVPEGAAGADVGNLRHHPGLSPFMPDLPADMRSGRNPAGWAATGKTAGVDGVERRWAYRFSSSPDTPVLHWDDPAGTARKLLEASLIRQAGLRRQALCAFSASAWFGLVPRPARREGINGLEPALSSIRQLSRSALRYGSSLLLEDEVPPEDIPILLSAGAAFVRDGFTPEPLRRALLTGDARPLAAAISCAASKGTDFRRLWRGSIPSPAGAAPTAAETAVLQSSPEFVLKAHALQIAVQAFLPGLLVLEASELSGSVPDGPEGSLPVWHMDGSPSTRRGLPAGRSAYSGSSLFSAEIAPLLRLRASSAIASSVLEGASASPDGSVLFLTLLLPDGSKGMLSANFTPRRSESGKSGPSLLPFGWTFRRS